MDEEIDAEIDLENLNKENEELEETNAGKKDDKKKKKKKHA